jgi:hypothetical protein
MIDSDIWGFKSNAETAGKALQGGKPKAPRGILAKSKKTALKRGSG